MIPRQIDTTPRLGSSLGILTPGTIAEEPEAGAVRARVRSQNQSPRRSKQLLAGNASRQADGEELIWALEFYIL